MSNYRRLISYIYAYEGGVKGKNIGFAKIETRGTQLKITVSVKKVYVGGNDVGVYLLAQDAEIYLGNIFIRGGSGEFRTVVSASDVEHSGINAEQCYGLTVHDVKNTWRSYTTIWEDAVAHAAEVDLASAAVKPGESGELSLSEAMIKRAVKEIEEEFPLPQLKPEEAVVDREKEERGQEEVPYQQSEELVFAGAGESSAANGPVIGEKISEQQQPMDSSEMDFSQYIQTDSGLELLQEAQEQTSVDQPMSIESQDAKEPLREQEHVEAEIQGEGKGERTESQQPGMAGQMTKKGTAKADRQQVKEEALEAAWQQMQQDGIEAAMEQAKRGGMEGFKLQVKQGDIEGTKALTRQEAMEAAEGHVSEKIIEIPIQQADQRRKEEFKQQYNQGGIEATGPQTNQSSAQAAAHQAKVTAIESMRQQTKEGEMRSSWGQQSLASAPSVPDHNSALSNTPLQRPVVTEAPVPDRTVCYRTDAVLQDQRSSGNSGASPASISEPSSARLRGQNNPGGESFQKDPTIKLTDPQELERLSKLEEEEESAHDRVWERLKREHTRILAFDYEKGCEILTIKPQDIGLLPREEWVYGNNSFLLHGYYNYRYLILAKLNNPEGLPRYLLGVPGHYYSNERYMASMFGFPNFVLSKEQPVGDGRFGYWYTDVKLGD